MHARDALLRDKPIELHMDIGVDDVDVAIAQVERIGGRLKYAPTLYPVPHDYAGARPLIDWAVMQDPFGDEFCLVACSRLPNARRSTQPPSMDPPTRLPGVPSPAAPDRSGESCQIDGPGERLPELVERRWGLGADRGRATIVGNRPPHVVELYSDRSVD